MFSSQSSSWTFLTAYTQKYDLCYDTYILHGYSRYINILSYSSDLLELFHQAPVTTGFLPFGPSIPNNLLSKFGYYSIPSNFQQYNLHSCFFVNFRKTFISQIICFSAFCFFAVFECMFSSKNKVNKGYVISKKARVFAMSFLLLQTYLSFGDIILFFSLQVISTPFSSVLSIVSFSFSLVFIIICLLLFAIHYRLLSKSQAFRKQGQQTRDTLDKFAKDYETLQVFFKVYKEGSFGHQAFFLFALIRLITVNIILGFLYQYPLIQAILLSLASLMMIIYIAYKKPFKSAVDGSQQLVCELSIGVVNFSILALAIVDIRKDLAKGLRERASSVVVNCNNLMKILPIIFLLMNILQAVISSWRSRRAASRSEKRVELFDQSSILGLNQSGRNVRKIQRRLPGVQDASKNQSFEVEWGNMHKHKLLEIRNELRLQERLEVINIAQDASELLKVQEIREVQPVIKNPSSVEVKTERHPEVWTQKKLWKVDFTSAIYLARQKMKADIKDRNNLRLEITSRKEDIISDQEKPRLQVERSDRGKVYSGWSKLDRKFYR